MNTAELERLASHAVYSAALLERAVHDRGPWTMRWGPIEVVAKRTVHEGGVSFEAVFPEACWITRPEPNVTLLCRGKFAAMRAVEHPGDTAFAVTWDLAAAVSSRAV
jgi:hypothetical protein